MNLNLSYDLGFYFCRVCFIVIEFSLSKNVLSEITREKKIHELSDHFVIGQRAQERLNTNSNNIFVITFY